jgi:hypothetical protein
MIQIRPCNASVKIMQPNINITGINAPSAINNNIGIATTEGNIKFNGISVMPINSFFSTKLSDNNYKFGYTTVLSTARDISVTIQSPFPLENLGCQDDDDFRYTCDEDFRYKDMQIEFDDVLQENKGSSLNVTKLDKFGKSYRLDFYNVKSFDPVVYSGGAIQIQAGSYYECATLDTDIDAIDNTLFVCTNNICELNARIENMGTFNVTNDCVVSNKLGDRIGRNALINTTSGGVLEVSYNATINSTAVATQSTIWMQQGSTGIFLNSTYDQIGSGTMPNGCGLFLENSNNVIDGNVFKAGRSMICLNTASYDSSSVPQLPPPSPLSELNNITNNLFTVGDLHFRCLTLFGSSNNNISFNSCGTYTDSGFNMNEATDAGIEGSPEYFNYNNTIYNNTLNANGQINANAFNWVGTTIGGTDNLIFNNLARNANRNLAGIDVGFVIKGNYNNITDNTCGGIGSTDTAGESGRCLFIGGHYNYVNGTNILNSVGGKDGGYAIYVEGQNNTFENNYNLICGSTKGGSVAYYFDTIAEGNYVDESYNELMNNDAKQIIGIQNFASEGVFKNIKLTSGVLYANGIITRGSNNVYMNIFGNFNSLNYPSSVMDFYTGDNNKVIDSNLTCYGANCGANNGVCDVESYTYGISGDAYYVYTTSGVYRTTLLNTTYTNWCSGNIAGDLDIYELEVQWYLNVTTLDNVTIGPINNVNISNYNNTDILISSTLTDTDGYSLQNLTEYIQNHTTSKWDFNYTINATNADYEEYSEEINFTDNTNLLFFMQRHSITDIFNDFTITLMFTLMAVGGLLLYIAHSLDATHIIPKIILYSEAFFINLIAVAIGIIINSNVNLSSLLNVVTWSMVIFIGYLIIYTLYKSSTLVVSR